MDKANGNKKKQEETDTILKLWNLRSYRNIYSVINMISSILVCTKTASENYIS